MKHIFLASILLAASVPAAAAWTSYAQTATTTELYDTASIVRSGATVKVWALTNHVTPLTNLEGKELLSEKSLNLINCADKKIGAEAVLTYAGRDLTGTEVGRMETPARLTPIKAGSPDETLMRAVCP